MRSESGSIIGTGAVPASATAGGDTSHCLEVSRRQRSSGPRSLIGQWGFNPHSDRRNDMIHLRYPVSVADVARSLAAEAPPGAHPTDGSGQAQGHQTPLRQGSAPFYRVSPALVRPARALSTIPRTSEQQLRRLQLWYR